MEWMLDIQLGRRNLSPIQRIAIAEKYRIIYQRQAKENISKAVSEANKKRNNPTLVNLPNMDFKPISASEKLAETAGVGTGSVARYNKIMKSNDEDLKEQDKTGI